MKILRFFVLPLLLFLSGCLGDPSSYNPNVYPPSSNPNYITPAPQTNDVQGATQTEDEYKIKFIDEISLKAAKRFDLVKEAGSKSYVAQDVDVLFKNGNLVLTYRRDQTFPLQAVFEPIQAWGRNIISSTKYELNNVYKLSGTPQQFVLKICLENEIVTDIKIGESHYKVSSLKPVKGISPDAVMLDNRYYEVQKGDNLTKIAKENGLTVQEILDAPENAKNPIHTRKNNYVKRGEVIYLPRQ